MPKRVVVTGMGVISPVGSDVPSFWSNLLNGVSGVDYIKSFDASGYSTQIAAEVRDFDPLKYFTQKGYQSNGSRYSIRIGGRQTGCI